jgi:hypothetical protein
MRVFTYIIQAAGTFIQPYFFRASKKILEGFSENSKIATVRHYCRIMDTAFKVQICRCRFIESCRVFTQLKTLLTRVLYTYTIQKSKLVKLIINI